MEGCISFYWIINKKDRVNCSIKKCSSCVEKGIKRTIGINTNDIIILWKYNAIISRLYKSINAVYEEIWRECSINHTIVKYAEKVGIKSTCSRVIECCDYINCSAECCISTGIFLNSMYLYWNEISTPCCNVKIKETINSA